VKLTMNVAEAAEILGVSPRCLRDSIKRGEITARRIGRRVLIPLVEVERLVGARIGDDAA